MAADETRCDVKDRLDSTELIPWQSGKDTVAEVDPCNDERVDKTRCHRGGQRTSDKSDTTELVEARKH